MEQEHLIDTLNELLKGEQMAIHIYSRTKKLQEDAQVAPMLARFEQDHKLHAKELTKMVKELGGEPNAKLGMPGLMANVMSFINSLRGPEHLLRQVYDGEDKGVNAYLERLEKLDPVHQAKVKQMLEEDHNHLKWFKDRMEEEKKERRKQILH